MRGKLIVFVGIALLFIAFFWFDLQQYLTLSAAQAFHLQVSDYIQANFIQSSLYFFMAYIGVTAFSIPGAAVVTLLGAALFGFWWSLLLVSFASTLGASIAFLMSRFLLKDWVQKEFGHRLQSFNDGFEKEGATYLSHLAPDTDFSFFPD